MVLSHLVCVIYHGSPRIPTPHALQVLDFTPALQDSCLPLASMGPPQHLDTRELANYCCAGSRMSPGLLSVTPSAAQRSGAGSVFLSTECIPAGLRGCANFWQTSMLKFPTSTPVSPSAYYDLCLRNALRILIKWFFQAPLIIPSRNSLYVS